MKDPNKHIAEEVEMTLELAENIQPARPSAFLKSRIMAQLEAEAVPAPEVSWWRRNRFAIAAAVFLLVANALTVLQYTGAKDQGQALEGIEAVAEAYDMNPDIKY